MWRKVVAFVDAHSLGQCAGIIGLFFLAGLTSAAVIDMPTMIRISDNVMQWHHNALPTIALVFAAYAYAPRFLHGVWGILPDLARSCLKLPESCPTSGMIEGIPVAELVDHLFAAKSFKRADIETRFAVPRYRVERLAAKLEEIGVLTRGANNARVLASDMSREAVAGIMQTSHLAEGLERPIAIIRPQRSPSPRFTCRKITEDVETPIAPCKPTCKAYATNARPACVA